MSRYRASLARVRKGAFSLTEVVLALAVFSLAIVSLLGLMSIALSSQRDSVMETRAANVASAIISERRAAPENPVTDSVLPKLSEMTGNDFDSAASEEVFVSTFGQKVSDSDPEAMFVCEYRAWGFGDTELPKTARVHLRLLWPVELAKRTPERAESYEVFTMISE